MVRTRTHAPGRYLLASLVLGALACGSVQAGEFDSYSGRQLYERFCASCHGSGGYGDGPVGKSLKVMVPDLTRISSRSGGTFPVERVRKVIDGGAAVGAHGTRLMPVWGYEFSVGAGADSDATINKLIDYLQGIQQ